MIFLHKDPGLSPRHAAIDGKVDGVGGTYEDVDDENNLLGDLVIQQVKLETGWEII